MTLGPDKLGKRPFGGAIGTLRWLRREPWVAHDLRWAIALHRAVVAHPSLLALLVASSRLGDGVVWYVLVLALPPWGGPPGVVCAIQMVAVGIADLALYYVLKHRVGRARPFVSCADIRACAPALDRYSFPSGHTLHAVANAILLAHHYPGFALLLAFYALFVAASRVVLGLHYPSDVLAGAAVGAATASVALAVWP